MRILRFIACAAAVLLPLAPLADPRVSFTYDWHNHEWMVGYVGEYFRQHLAMPPVLNVPSAVGMPQPVFYGFLLYPVLGVISAATGAAWALRVGVAAALVLEFVAVYGAARRTVGSWRGSFVLAAASVWSVYGLTNLYNRAALTEFFAVAFLTAAVGFGVAAMAGRRHSALLAWLAGVSLTLALGSHPPTALIGSLFVAVVAMATLPSLLREARQHAAALRSFGSIAVVSAVIVAPWVQANLALRGALGIIGKYPTLYVGAGRVDAWAARFSPVPYDPLPLAQARADIPYIEAPIAWAVLLLVLWNAVLLLRVRRSGSNAPGPRWAGALAWASLAWSVVTLAISLSQPVADVFKVFGPYVQFATRFVSHANLGLLTLCLASGAAVAARGGYRSSRKATFAVVAVALAIAGLNLGIKLQHADAVATRDVQPQFAWTGDRSGLVTAGKPDAAADYAAVRTGAVLRREVAGRATKAALPVGTGGQRFGEPLPMDVRCASAGWVITNVVAFPWNRVWIDGRDSTESAVVADGYCDALWLPVGEHRIEWRWEPPTLWRVLTTLSRGLLLLTVIGAFVATVLTFTRRRAPARLPD